MLYRPLNICRRMSDSEALVYRCFEVLPGRGFVVQSADRIRTPVVWEDIQHHEKQFWELFCETAPEERSPLYPNLEDAIAAFDAEFDIQGA